MVPVSWISPPIFVAVIISSCLGERNITKKLFDEEEKGRFLSFNNDASNIRLEIVFAVPFLHIPIGAANLQEGGPKPIIDINAKSLIVTSVILFMLVFVVPGLVRLLLPSPPPPPLLHFGYGEAGARGFMERMENTLANMGIDSGECWRKGVCTLVSSASENVALGRATSWDKIIDGVTQNSWINRVVPSSLLPTGCLKKTDYQQHFQCPIAFNRSTFFNIITELMKRFQNLSTLNDI